MRTPGFGDRRLSSTRGVCPMACTMSPYFPPQGRLSRRGSIIASKSVVPLLYPEQPAVGQSMLACAGEHFSNVLGPRSDLLRLLPDHLVDRGGAWLAFQQYLGAPPSVGVAGGLLGVQLAQSERQLP